MNFFMNNVVLGLNMQFISPEKGQRNGQTLENTQLTMKSDLFQELLYFKQLANLLFHFSLLPVEHKILGKF